jgi:voltage-gated potassium channel
MTKYNTLPFIHIENKKNDNALKNKKFSRIMVDVLDGDIWSSKVSFIGNSILLCLITYSVIEVVFGFEFYGINELNFFSVFHFAINILFTIEFFFRIFYARFIFEGSSQIKAICNYVFSFYGIIDLLSILPFWLSFCDYTLLDFLLIIRVLRIWRVARYISAFSSISDAFRSKRDEMLVSFLGVILLSLTLSSFIYYAESKRGSSDFDSILSVFIWSIGKYTGDYGSIAGAAPITFIGKLLATVNGLLGLALFAIPAGLLGSAFIDSLSNRKQKKIVDERIKLIDHYFEQSRGGNKSLAGKKVYPRFFVFETIQTRFLLSDGEILEAIRESDQLRFRAMKSNSSVRYNDTKLVERYLFNTSYGTKIESNKNIYIINPSGAIERCISHFAYTLADNLKYHFISRERRFYFNEEEMGSNYSTHYEAYNPDAEIKYPETFGDFMNDLNNISKDDFVIVIKSSASGRGDFILEYGNAKGQTEIKSGISTINNEVFLSRFTESLHNNAKLISFESARATIEEFSFTIENHSIGNFDQKWIGKTIHRLTGANVITIYININILIGEDDRYYAALNVLQRSLESTFEFSFT